MNKRLTRLTRFVTIDPAQTYGRREELRQLARRSHQVVAWAAVTGVITGLFVAALDRIIVDGLVSRVLTLSPWIAAPLPGVGLLIALGIRSLGRPGVSPATADEYLHAFHDPAHQLALRDLAIRSGAAIAGLGAGLPMGLEGPSLYAGATIGSAVQRRLPRVFRGAEHRVLMVAGAAAGVAAIFKTPATGAVFALEVPYRDDLARRMLLPALVASACGYLTFVSINGTAALIPVGGNPAFTIVDLLGAVALGIIAGIGARAFAWMLRHAKTVAAAPRPLLTTIASGVGLAAVFGLGRALTGESLILGSGYQVIKWATIPGHSLWILGVMFLLRSFATALAVAGGGTGGLFIPLVASGALCGSIIGNAVNHHDLSLFMLIGVAAFLGAGYRVPLASVMFVAEATGRPSFIVPGLLAAVAAELMMGASSVTRYQRDGDPAVDTLAPTDLTALAAQPDPHPRTS